MGAGRAGRRRRAQGATGGGGTIVTTASTEPFNPPSNVDGPHAASAQARWRCCATRPTKHDLEPGDTLGIATRDGVAAGRPSSASYDLGERVNARRHRRRVGPAARHPALVRPEGEVTDDQRRRRATASRPRSSSRRIRARAARRPRGPHRRRRRPTRPRDEINEQIGGFLTPALLAFAGAALLVGAFIIFNTFTITVAERTREFAMLRTLGRDPRPDPRAVATEALVIGVRGVGARPRARARRSRRRSASLFEAFGFGHPHRGRGARSRARSPSSLVVGVGVTQIAALAPARRATRVPPIAALQAATSSSGSRRALGTLGSRRIVAVLGVGAAGAPVCSAAGPAASRLSTMAGGVVLLFVGVALSARWFVRPLAGGVGWPLERLFAEPGLLARENAMRNPGRTATTAAALMVGLGLVVFVAVFANGIKASFDETRRRRSSRQTSIVRSRDDAADPGRRRAASSAARRTSPQVRSVLVDQVEGQRQEQVEHDHRHHERGRRRRASRSSTASTGCEGDDTVARPPARRHRADRGAVREGARRRRRRRRSRSRRRPAARRELRVLGIYRDPQLLQGTIVPQDLLRRACRRPATHGSSSPHVETGVDTDVAKRAPRRRAGRLPDRRRLSRRASTRTQSAASSTSSSTSSTRCWR